MAAGMWQGLNQGYQQVQRRALANEELAQRAAERQATNTYRQIQQGMMQDKADREAGIYAQGQDTAKANRWAVSHPKLVRGLMGTELSTATPALDFAINHASPDVLNKVSTYQTPEEKSQNKIAEAEALQRVKNEGNTKADLKIFNIDGKPTWMRVAKDGALTPLGLAGKVPSKETTKQTILNLGGKPTAVLVHEDGSYTPIGEAGKVGGGQGTMLTMPDGTTVYSGDLTGKSFNNKSGQKNAERYDLISKDLEGVENNLTNIYSMRALLTKGKLKTGALAPFKQKAANIATSLGIKPESLGLDRASSAEMFNSIVMKNLLNELMKQKGIQTEGDADRAKATFASLEGTTEGNLFILNYAEALARRQQEKLHYINSVRDKFKGNYTDAYDDWLQNPKFRSLMAVGEKGNPYTYYQYVDRLKRKDPTITDDKAITLWKRFSGEEQR